MYQLVIALDYLSRPPVDSFWRNLSNRFFNQLLRTPFVVAFFAFEEPILELFWWEADVQSEKNGAILTAQ